jgi:hypothetical protein
MFGPVTFQNANHYRSVSSLDENTKKKLIAWLLGVSCLVSLWILVSFQNDEQPQLRQLAQLDTLVTDQFRQYNILPYQVETKRIMVDTLFERVAYNVRVPLDFSKTQWHASLNHVLHEYGVATPAQVQLPKDQMSIHVMKHGTVVRSIEMVNDTALTLQRIPASILIYFEEAPSENAISEILRLGEPIPIILQSEAALETDAVQQRVRTSYNRLGYWLVDQDGLTLNRRQDHRIFLDRVEQLHKIDPAAPILLFSGGKPVSERFIDQSRSLDLRYIDVSSAQMIDADVRRFTFQQAVQRFMMRAQQQEHPLLLMAGSSDNIAWLHEELSELKKNGLYLTQPPTMDY